LAGGGGAALRVWARRARKRGGRGGVWPAPVGGGPVPRRGREGGAGPAGGRAARAGGGQGRARRPRRTAEAALRELKARLLEINDIAAASGLLGWDQATYMPAHGAMARARQGATLSRLAHEPAIDPDLGTRLHG